MSMSRSQDEGKILALDTVAVEKLVVGAAAASSAVFAALKVIREQKVSVRLISWFELTSCCDKLAIWSCSSGLVASLSVKDCSPKEIRSVTEV